MKTSKPIANICDQTPMFGGVERQKGFKSRCRKYSITKSKSISNSSTTTTIQTGYQGNKCNDSNLLSVTTTSKMEGYLKFTEAKSRYLQYCDHLNDEERRRKMPLSVILRGKKFKDKATTIEKASLSARYTKARTAVIYLTILTTFLTSLSIINCQISTRSADNRGK